MKFKFDARKYRWPIVFLILGIVFTLARFVVTANDPNSFKKITAMEAQEILDAHDDVIIFDMRPEQDYLIGHIPGATNIHPKTITYEYMEDLTKGDQSYPIMVCGSSNSQSKKTARKISNSGFTNVYDLGEPSNWQELIP